MIVPKPVHKKKKKIKHKSQRKIGKIICVKLAKKIIRSRGKCEKCGKKKSAGWQMHGAHIVPVSFSHTAANIANILCLCASCHSMGSRSMHDNPLLFARWLDEKHPGRYEVLWKMAQDTTKMNWEEEYKYLLKEAYFFGVKP